jgi:hypothetical protein
MTSPKTTLSTATEARDAMQVSAGVAGGSPYTWNNSRSQGAVIQSRSQGAVIQNSAGLGSSIRGASISGATLDGYGNTGPSLTEGAYALPLDTLRGLWEVRFGDRWVSLKEIRAQEDALFYEDAAWRLQNISLLECAPGAVGTHYRIVPRTK